MGKQTPLYQKHVDAGGKIVPFGGYDLPVQYKTGVIKEHMAVREKAGLFDVSHMGEVFFEGKDAFKNIQYIFTNNFTTLKENGIRYTVLCQDDGGILDDMLVYKFNDEKFMVVPNAANLEKDFKWMQAHVFGEVELTNRTDDYGLLAIQGPNARTILKKVMSEDDFPEKYYTFKDHVKIGGIDCLLSQTGYTGEDGFEIYLKAEDAPKMWDLLLVNGEDEGLIPCGLGARDTLRFEAGMPLYGNEMDETIDPFEADLSFTVKLKKEEDFIGKKALSEKTEPKRHRIGLKVTGKGIVREHEDVYQDDKLIGHTTSGTHLPYLGGAYAMALVDSDYGNIGDIVEADVRGRRVTAEVIAIPFYKRA